MSTSPLPKVLPLPIAKNANDLTDSGIFTQAAAFGLEDVHFKIDHVSGLKAIIAIHNTSRGPALGGTRCLAYASEQLAVQDAMQLARGMSYKSAFAQLPYGGGKAVLIQPKQITNRNAYFESYGKFVDSLNGRYITAVDVGTRVEDMDIIARQTRYVLSTSASRGDPSHDTARGVLHGIMAAVARHFRRDDLEGTVVAIQGVGKVGFYLAGLLHSQGAKLLVSDINAAAAQRCADQYGAEIVAGDHLYQVQCDVFSPCALGGSMNPQTLRHISAGIVCGAANNQLASEKCGDMLYQKGIFYVPDYVVNAGGLIHVVLASTTEVEARVKGIYNSVCDIYQSSKKNQEPSHRVANRIAEKILSDSKQIQAHL